MSKHCLPSVSPMETHVGWDDMGTPSVGKKSDGEYVRLRQQAVCLKQLLKLTTVHKSSHRQYVNTNKQSCIPRSLFTKWTASQIWSSLPTFGLNTQIRSTECHTKLKTTTQLYVD